MIELLNDIEQQRFMDAIFLLKNRKMIKSISALCTKFGKNKNYLSDVMAKNVRISTEFLQAVLSNYPINEHFILTGDGEILLNSMDEKSVVQNNVAGDNIQGGNVSVEKQQESKLIELLRNADVRLAKSQEQIDRLIGIIEKFSGNEKE